jgi:hypothetical protein
MEKNYTLSWRLPFPFSAVSEKRFFLPDYFHALIASFLFKHKPNHTFPFLNPCSLSEILFCLFYGHGLSFWGDGYKFFL